MQNDDQVTNNPTKLDANLQKTVNSAISLKKKKNIQERREPQMAIQLNCLQKINQFYI